ncbi:MAG: hypothetical protein ACKOS8_10595 [Gemmataceae bacterium]
MLKLNVGLNRKVGEPNYGSRGGSVNMEVELDNSLMQEPERLRETVSRLFAMVRQSLEMELGADSDCGRSGIEPVAMVRPEKQTLQEAITAQGRQATAKQLSFLQNLARTQRRDLQMECLEQFETFPERLTSKQASAMIEKWRASLVTAR